MRRLLPLAVTIALLLPAQGAAAARLRYCDFDGPVTYRFGFADLKAALGDRMGDPIECEHPDPNGSGDTLQHAGDSFHLAYWRKWSNTPTFYDGATHYALTGNGLISWDGPSIDPPNVTQPTGPAAVGQPAPSAPAPALAPPTATPVVSGPAQHTSVIMLAGIGSDSDRASQMVSAWVPRLSLPGGGSVYPFSYAGGSNPYDKWSTFQALDQSAAYLRDRIVGLKANGERVAVIGFSLGGLVAYEQLWQALSDNSGLERPDVVVTISSPLQGVDPGKREKCGLIAASGVLGGLATGGTLGLVLGGLGLTADLLCPRDPIVSQLEAIYGDAPWRARRDAYVTSAARAAGTRLMTIGNANDCLYYLDCVSVFGGGENVRFTTLVQGADYSRLFDIPPPCNSGLDGCMKKVHASILEDGTVQREVSRFIAP